MSAILFIQSGDNGPVRLVSVQPRGIKRALEGLQRGNPEVLHIRLAIVGDERTERKLHTLIDAHYIARDWYEPVVVDMIPPTFTQLKYDGEAERQRVASLRLDEMLRRAG
jgi:hypothetical protein